MYFQIQLGSFNLAFGMPPYEPVPKTSINGERKLISAAKYLIADRGFRASEAPFGDLSLDEAPQDDELFAALRLISDVINGRTNFVSVDECVDALLNIADETCVLACAATLGGSARIVVEPTGMSPVDYLPGGR